MKKYLGLLILLILPGLAWAGNWNGFYDQKTLQYWSQQMPPGIRANLEEVVWPKLTPEERQALQGVTLALPLEEAQKNHPMNFYSLAQGQEKIIVLPISSLRFLGDLALAYVWLNQNGYSLDPITEYLAMLKYQWPRNLAGRPYRPLEVLGIPKNAGADPKVQKAFQEIFGSAVVFIMAHELGHLYYQHRDYGDISAAQARTQEEAADGFALEIMRRVGEAPLGIYVFFSILAHLEPYAGDAGYLQYRTRTTHPLSTARIRTLLTAVERESPDFVRTSPHPLKTQADLQKIAAELAVVAQVLDDQGVQAILRQKGLTAKPESLGPRRPGELMAQAQAGPAPTRRLFDGAYSGDWVDAKGTSLPVELSLNRQGEEVKGSYTFGAGQVSLAGIIRDGRLYYKWHWGADHFGNGVLSADAGGEHLTGTWGYTKSATSGGKWQLHRKLK